MKPFFFLAVGFPLLLSAEALQCKNQDIVDGCKDKTQSNGEEWYDSGGPSSQGGSLPNCKWYGDYWDRCQRDGNQHENFGMTACEACCVCGGGTDEEKVCDDEPRWYVVSPNGDENDCDWFADNDARCDKHGSVEGRFDMSADEACCACGGGTEEKKVCEDKANWFVVSPNGNENDCDWFAGNDERCDKHGDADGRFDMSADQACCVCGGGTTENEDDDGGDW